MPRPSRSVLMSTLEDPVLNSFIILSLSTYIIVIPYHLHIPVHLGDHKSQAPQLGGQLNNPLLLIGEDHALSNFDVLVEFDEGLELPLLPIDRDVVLFDTVEGQLLVLDEDADGVAHELVRHLQDLGGHRGREQGDLDVGWELLDDLFHLVHEASAEHFVGFVQDDDLQIVGVEVALGDEVEDTPGGAHHDVDSALLEAFLVFGDDSAAHAGVAHDFEELADAHDDSLDLLGELTGGGQDEGLAVGGLGVDELENTNRKGCSLAGSGLRLGDGVAALDDGKNASLLDDRGLLKAIS